MQEAEIIEKVKIDITACDKNYHEKSFRRKPIGKQIFLS